MANAVIYARYSSAGQREESIEDQVRVCRQAAERDGAAIARVYHDDATTGRTAEGRDGFLRMVADARRGLFDVVYVYKLDRFARNRYDAAVYKAKLRRCGVELRSATEAVGDGPESILLESMLEGLAEYYSVALAENVKRGQLGNAMKCKHNGVRTYGYDLGEDGYYHVNEEEAAVVRRMFRMYADGASMPEIAAAMPEARTKMGKPLSVGFISKSLRLEKYRGVYSYGQTRVEGGMPAIVDGELFEGVQGMLAARARRRRSTMEYLLSGKLFDAEGHRYQSSSGHGKSGRKYTYYRCPATGHQVPQHVLEDAVAKAAADVIAADDDAVEAIVAMVMAAQAEEMADSIAAADATRKRLEQNAREQSRVVDLAAKTGAVDAVAAKLGQLADEREELEASLAEMELSCAMVDEERAEFWVRRLMGRSDPLEAVRLFVDRVVLDREAGEMRVAFSFDGIKKNPHQAESDGGSRNCRLAGICRGMQMINVFFGGTLYLDLEEQFDGMCAVDDVPVPAEGVQTKSGVRVNHWQTKEYRHPTHTVSIMRSSKLGEILGCDSAAVNSMHHQGVRALPPNLAAAAYGPDGLVEGVEAKDCRFLMGVQWHPEYFAEDGGHMAPLFRALIDEARQMRCREGRCHDCLRIDREECDPNAVWPAVKFADYI